VNNQGLGFNITFSAAAADANETNVTLTVVDNDGNTLAEPWILDVWLSDASTGVGLTGTTASGAVEAETNGGTVLVAMTAKKALRVQTLATGKFVLTITDTAKTGFFVCATVPGSGRTAVSDQLVTADYGS